ncbi:MAG: hypothetical protein PHQ23_16990 [Candidatus Wallbacteria bacterium]|nr:hypothetical protein [Candidatus Wallbacteria bacterium]
MPPAQNSPVSKPLEEHSAPPQTSAAKPIPSPIERDEDSGKRPPHCNYICSLCNELDCPERWK